MSSQKEKAMIVRGAGLLTSIFSNLQKKVEEFGGSEKDIHRLTTPEGEETIGKLAQIIVDDGRKKRISFPVTVDSSQTLHQMTGAYPYTYINSDVTLEHFPMKGQGKRQIEVTLFHFNRLISSDNAIAEMATEGFRPAEPEELINLSAQHPGQDLQKELPIVAINSPWQYPNGPQCVVCLIRRDAGRGLELHWLKDDLHVGWHFAAVCK